MNFLGPEEKLRNRTFSGGLLTTINKDFKSVNFSFNLLDEKTPVDLSPHWLKIHINVKINKSRLTNNSFVYKDSLDSNSSERFKVDVYNKSEYQQGVVPAHWLGTPEIQNLSFTMTTQGAKSNLNNMRLTQLSLILPSFNKSSRSYHFEYKNHSNVAYARTYVKMKKVIHMVRLLFLKNVIFSPLITILMIFASLITSKAGISRILFYYKHRFLSTRDFNFFYELEVSRFMAIVFFYNTFWDIPLIILYMIVDILLEARWAVIFSSIFQKCCKNNRELEIAPKKLTGLKFEQRGFSTGFLQAKQCHGRYPRTSYEKCIANVCVQACVVYPALVEKTGLWVLLGALIYSMALFRYENPSFVDFLSVVAFFGCLLLRYLLFVTYYKALAVKFFYLEPLWKSWGWMTQQRIDNYLRVMGVFSLFCAVNFFFFKNDLKNRLLGRKKKKESEISHEIGVRRTNLHSLGFISIKHTESQARRANESEIDKMTKSLSSGHLQLSNPLSNGVYLTHALSQWKFVIWRLYYQSKELMPSWGILLKKSYDRRVESIFALKKVMIDFEQQPELMVVVSRENSQWLYNYQFDVVNLRRRKKIKGFEFKRLQKFTWKEGLINLDLRSLKIQVFSQKYDPGKNCTWYNFDEISAKEIEREEEEVRKLS